jgi:hypothetical protein
MFTSCLKYIHSLFSRNLFESWCIFFLLNLLITSESFATDVQQNFYQMAQFEQKCSKTFINCFNWNQFFPRIPRISQGCFQTCPLLELLLWRELTPKEYWNSYCDGQVRRTFGTEYCERVMNVFVLNITCYVFSANLLSSLHHVSWPGQGRSITKFSQWHVAVHAHTILDTQVLWTLRQKFFRANLCYERSQRETYHTTRPVIGERLRQLKLNLDLSFLCNNSCGPQVLPFLIRELERYSPS